jgi:hypothetical protein
MPFVSRARRVTGGLRLDLNLKPQRQVYLCRFSKYASVRRIDQQTGQQDATLRLHMQIWIWLACWATRNMAVRSAVWLQVVVSLAAYNQATLMAWRLSVRLPEPIRLVETRSVAYRCCVLCVRGVAAGRLVSVVGGYFKFGSVPVRWLSGVGFWGICSSLSAIGVVHCIVYFKPCGRVCRLVVVVFLPLNLHPRPDDWPTNTAETAPNMAKIGC